MDAITQNPDATWMSQFQQHLDADLQHAHKATLPMLGVNNLQDWAMATADDILGNSTNLIVNVAFCKMLIRGYNTGEWQ